MRILFRVDATGPTGSGHIMRCFALAEEFQSRGGEIVWLSRIDISWVASKLSDRSWTVMEPLADSLAQIRDLAPDLVVLDSYDLPAHFSKSLVDARLKVLSIVDDSYESAQPATLWVNPGVRISHLTLPNERFLNGPDYVLIRSEIRRLRDRRSQVDGTGGVSRTVAVLLGGSDHSDFAEIVSKLDPDLLHGIELIAGPSSRRDGQPSITWLPGGDELLDRAALAGVVLSAAGVSSWEFLHIGTPLALMLTAGNQSGNYEWFTSQGLAYPCGSRSELTKPGKLARKLVHIQEFLLERPISEGMWIDGHGARRVTNLALKLM